jgi:hypothetical protein|tara:strand:+ start:84 stop:482 length:399 start_codon:yes stop_codon:yes gene_type:complete
MINPTLAYAHLNKGEPGMVQKTPLVSNLMDAGTASKVALNPQEQISSQQLLTKVGQDADTAVIGNIAAQEGAMRTAQLKQSQAEQDAAQAISTMIYAKYGANSATSSFANPGEAERRGISVMQQLGMKNAMS